MPHADLPHRQHGAASVSAQAGGSSRTCTRPTSEHDLRSGRMLIQTWEAEEDIQRHVHRELRLRQRSVDSETLAWYVEVGRGEHRWA